jgi:hypothetical protein
LSPPPDDEDDDEDDGEDDEDGEDCPAGAPGVETGAAHDGCVGEAVDTTNIGGGETTIVSGMTGWTY